MSAHFKTVIQSARPPFLLLTPVCVWLGIAVTHASHVAIDHLAVVFVLLGAMAAHISVNALNEYFDFTSGLDLITERTPFSGGSGALPVNPAAARMVLALGISTLLLTIAIGLYFIALRGAQIIPFGVVGIVLIATYTQWINRMPLLCLIAPGTGFGLLMVMGTQIALTGQVTVPGALAALVPFFLVNNLLLLNQFPDIEADTQIGRRTFPIVFGVRTSSAVFLLFSAATYLLIVILVWRNDFPARALLALLPMPLQLYALSGAWRYTIHIGIYRKYLAANVAATLLTPLLLGFSFFG